MIATHRALTALLALVGLTWLGGAYTCPVATLLHLPCPTCGLTRATSALVRGNWVEAHRLQPLVTVTWLVMASSFAVEFGTDPRSRLRGARNGMLALLGLALFVVWAGRAAGYWGGPIPVGCAENEPAAILLGLISA